MPGFESTKKEIRYRLKSPKKFDKNSFGRKKISKGVSLIVACPKGNWSPKVERCRCGTQAQAVRFNKKYFTLKKARKWISKHKHHLRRR